MRLDIRLGSLCAALCLLVGCAALGPEISSDRNPVIDVSQLKTWAWVDPLGTDRAGYEAIVTTRLKNVVQDELEARGMRYSEEAPQARVNFYVNLEEAQEVRVISRMRPGLHFDYYGYYGYRVGLYDLWMEDTLTTRSYTRGTLTIDVVDVASSKVAWTAKAQGRVTRAALDDPDTAVRDVVTAMFEQFP